MAITSIDDFSPIYVGDTLKPLAPQFWTKDNAGNWVPLPLTGSAVSIIIVDNNGHTVDSGNLTIDDAPNGKAHWNYQAVDTSVASTYTIFMKITDGTGKFVHADPRILEVKWAP